MSKLNVKTVIFDLDNTLIDRQAAAYSMYINIVKDCFPDYSREDMEFESIVQDLMTWDEFGSITKKHPFSMLCKKYGLNLELIDILNERWKNELFSYTVLFPDVEKLLKKLKNKYQLAIITNGDSTSQWNKLRVININKYFSKIIVSGDVGIHKPDIRIFEMMLNELNVEASNCVFIGDTFSTDIIGASNAGMQTIWICSDKKRANAPFVNRIYTIDELDKFI